MKLAGLFKKAYAEAGVALPEKPEKQEPLQTRSVTPERRKASAAQPSRKSSEPAQKKNGHTHKPKANKPRVKKPKSKHRPDPPPEPDNVKSAIVTASGVLITRRAAPEPRAVLKRTATPSTVPAAPKSANNKHLYRITAHPGARVSWQTYVANQASHLLQSPASGQEVELHASGTEKHLFLGLDFGTSTLKAVIHDKERNRSYAVPFRDIPGVHGYLLPCRVFLGPQGYNLEGHGEAYQDLKLSFLASPESIEVQQPVVGFIALALRMIRGWLLSEHGETYNGSIVWNMVMGLPVAHSGDDQTSIPFHLLGTAAWLSSSYKDVTPDSVIQAITRAKELASGAEFNGNNEDVEVKVMPEAAAQVYGYVSSSDFDPGARNNYLMVDIGAGTLDASVFHINREKRGGKVSLVVYKTTVEPHGVMNLHTKRIKWLLSALEERLPERTDLQKALKRIDTVTDALEPIPDKIDGYFDNLSISFQSKGPDDEFYAKVKTQITRDTYEKVADEMLIARPQLTGMPMYLCGGGSRSAFYARLKEDMSSAPNHTWFGTVLRQLQKPRTLVAKGLASVDYDRLSVAYGLSQIRLGKVIVNVPPLDEANRTDYTDRYTDKSAV